MSSATLSHNRQPNIITPIIIVICLAGIALIVGVALPQVIPNALPGHAEHSEAQEIRDCNTVEAIYINKACQRFTIVKELEAGRYGGQVVQPCKRGVLEITAFVFASAGKPLDMKMIDTILKAKGCVKIWP